MKCIECGKYFTEADSDNENINTSFVKGEIVLWHDECPVEIAESYQFKWYLHGDNLRESVEEFAEMNELPLEIAEKIADHRPFYEVTISCEYFVENDEVVFVGAKL